MTKVKAALIAAICVWPCLAHAQDDLSYSNIAQQTRLIGTCETLHAAFEVNERQRSEEGDRVVLALWRAEASRFGMSVSDLRQVCVRAVEASDEIFVNLQIIDDETARISDQLSVE